jgi:large subunit ribosomal protein L25
MAERLQLEAQSRTLVGRKVRQLRNAGLVPVVVYGNVEEPENLQVSARSLERTLQAGGTTLLVQVNVEGGKTHNVLIRDVQRHPVRHSLMHADLYAINMREKQQVSVPIVGINRPENVPAGLMLLQSLDEVEIEALPVDIPAQIEVDVSGVDLDNSITVADLPVPPSVEFLTDPAESVFSMVTTREELEEEVEEAVPEGAEEPEVIGREAEEGEEEVAEEEA